MALQIVLSTGMMQQGTYVSDYAVILPGEIQTISDDELHHLYDRAQRDPEHLQLLYLTASVEYVEKREKGM